MSVSEFEQKRWAKLLGQFVESRRPPPHLRAQVDLGFNIADQSAEIFEVRANWRDPTNRRERPFAKATYNRSKGTWKIYWQRSDLKWHSYEPSAEVPTLEEFIAVVEKDQHGCFFG